MKKTFNIIRAVLVVILLCFLFLSGTAFYTVNPNEYGVVTHLGKITKVSTEAGLYTKLPFLESVRYILRQFTRHSQYCLDFSFFSR